MEYYIATEHRAGARERVNMLQIGGLIVINGTIIGDSIATDGGIDCNRWSKDVGQDNNM
jgi:hypothetical protein